MKTTSLLERDVAGGCKDVENKVVKKVVFILSRPYAFRLAVEVADGGDDFDCSVSIIIAKSRAVVHKGVGGLKT